MFDIGTGELLVLGAIALVVIGPEKLPTVARTLGALLGRMQGFVSSVKSEINNEIGFSELSVLHHDLKTTAGSFRQQVKQEIDDLRASFSDLENIAAQDKLLGSSNLDLPLEDKDIDDRQMNLVFDEPERPESH